MSNPDEFIVHEALHMANFLAGCVGSELSDHPAVLANPQWLELATRAEDALHELYQAIGQEHL